jgi:D-alanyl-D-alanine carboxypeptidase/D-alanyl-D-alanine-endopeptidase (penicillin-binding protein 4)
MDGLLQAAAMFAAMGSGTRWDEILDSKGASRITFGVSLGGPSPYDRNKGVQFVPASNTKLFTAVAALDRMGPEMRYRTTLSWRLARKNDESEVAELTITGSGDPTWGNGHYGEDLDTRVKAWAEELWNQGVRVVDGEIRAVADDERWNKLRLPEGWKDSYKTSCNTSLAQGINLALNCATFVVSDPHEGAWREKGVPIPVKLALREGDETELEVEAVDSPGRVASGFVVTGTFGRDDDPHELRLPVHDAGKWAANRMRAALRARGMRFASVEDSANGPARTIEFLSRPLGEILKPFLKWSINPIGEAIFKTLGARFAKDEPDLVTAGQRVLAEEFEGLGSHAAVAAGVAPQPGFYANDIHLNDGSGASRENYVTTTAVMALLLDLRASSHFGTIWEALPIAGVDGTLKNRMKGTPAEGMLRAKTGTHVGAYALSGYVPHLTRDGTVDQYIPFVMLTRTTESEMKLARALEDRLGAELARVVRDGQSPDQIKLAVESP